MNWFLWRFDFVCDNNLHKIVIFQLYHHISNLNVCGNYHENEVGMSRPSTPGGLYKLSDVSCPQKTSSYIQRVWTCFPPLFSEHHMSLSLSLCVPTQGIENIWIMPFPPIFQFCVSKLHRNLSIWCSPQHCTRKEKFYKTIFGFNSVCNCPKSSQNISSTPVFKCLKVAAVTL